MSHVIGTMGDLKNWVTAKDSENYSNLPEDIVVLSCTHNLLKKEMKELRLSLHMTIEELKGKLYRHCGTSPEWMSLVLKDSDGTVLCELADDHRKLGYYGARSGMSIKIVDRNPRSLAIGGGLEDLSLVKKYVMTDEEYDKRENTLRAFKKEKLKQDPTFKLFPDRNKKETKAPATKEDAAEIEVGKRCEVRPGGRRGRVGFVGEVNFAIGTWVGVILDEPLGKNDGSVKGKRYMTCAPRHGSFVDPRNVVCGDFPEVDDDDLLTSSDEEEL